MSRDRKRRPQNDAGFPRVSGDEPGNDVPTNDQP